MNAAPFGAPIAFNMAFYAPDGGAEGTTLRLVAKSSPIVFALP